MARKIILTPQAYKDGVLYARVPLDGSGDFDISRGNASTRFDEQGLLEELSSTKPQLDYSTRDCPVLLLEGARTNYIANNSGTAGWSSIGRVLPGYADETRFGVPGVGGLVWDESGSLSNLYTPLSPVGADTGADGFDLTTSFYIDANDFTEASERVRISISRGGGSGDYAQAYYSPIEDKYYSSHAGGTAGNLFINSTHVNFATFEAVKHTSSSLIRIVLRVDFKDIIKAGDSSGVFRLFTGVNTTSPIWIGGVQIEAGVGASSLILTTGVAKTRNNTYCDRYNVDSLINDSEGMIELRAQNLVTEGTYYTDVINLIAGSTNSRLRFIYYGGGNNDAYRIDTVYGGVDQPNVNAFATGVLQTDMNDFKIKWDSNGVSLKINDTEVITNAFPEMTSTLTGLDGVILKGSSVTSVAYEYIAIHDNTDNY